MIRETFIIHALSPLHSGTGQAVDIIDLPIARMRATGIPMVPGSSIKGVLRDAAESRNSTHVKAVFGPETADASDNSGALMVGDARLLVLPVRSLRGVFAWVTSPLLLRLAARDLAFECTTSPLPEIQGRRGIRGTGNSVVEYNKRIYLEDLDIDLSEEESVDAWRTLIAERSFADSAERDAFSERFVVLDDETMSFLWETATQVDARNQLTDKGTVRQGALWYEESLPPETLLIGSVAAEKSRDPQDKMSENAVMTEGVPDSHVLQLGGKATVGRGVCRMTRGAQMNGGQP